MNNLLKYALGLNAADAESHQVLRTHINSDGHLVLTFMRARVDLTYTVEISNNLTIWSDFVVNPGEVGTVVNVVDTGAVPTHTTKRFLRLKVSGE